MAANTLLVLLPVIFIFITTASGLIEDDVDGTLGYGMAFDKESVKILGWIENVNDSSHCCEECKMKQNNSTQMIELFKFYRGEKDPDPVDPKINCLCQRPIPNKRPVTVEEEDFLGFCGDDSSLNITIGEGRCFDSDANKWYREIAENVEDKSECCSKCGTDMFGYTKSQKICICYTTDQTIQPVSLAIETFSAICGKGSTQNPDDGDKIEKITASMRDDTVGEDEAICADVDCSFSIAKKECPRKCASDPEICEAVHCGLLNADTFCPIKCATGSNTDKGNNIEKITALMGDDAEGGNTCSTGPCACTCLPEENNYTCTCTCQPID